MAVLSMDWRRDVDDSFIEDRSFRLERFSMRSQDSLMALIYAAAEANAMSMGKDGGSSHHSFFAGDRLR